MAKKVQLKDNSGNKAYPVTSSACVGMSDGSGNLDDYVKKFEARGYLLAGIATPSTNPGVPDGNVFYIAYTAGTYVNFSNITVNSNEVVFLLWKGTWTKKTIGLATAEELNALNTVLNQTKANIFYAVCNTDSTTAAKVVTMANFVLSINTRFVVKMTYTNTAASPTLNVNNTGAKPLYYNGEIASADNTWEAGEVVDVYYDGTNYQASNVQGGISKEYLSSLGSYESIGYVSSVKINKIIGYIDKNGHVGENMDYSYTEPIYVEKGKIYTIRAKGVGISVISKYNDGSYTPVYYVYNNYYITHEIQYIYEGDNSYIVLSGISNSLSIIEGYDISSRINIIEHFAKKTIDFFFSNNLIIKGFVFTQSIDRIESPYNSTIIPIYIVKQYVNQLVLSATSIGVNDYFGAVIYFDKYFNYVKEDSIGTSILDLTSLDDNIYYIALNYEAKVTELHIENTECSVLKVLKKFNDSSDIFEINTDNGYIDIPNENIEQGYYVDKQGNKKEDQICAIAKVNVYAGETLVIKLQYGSAMAIISYINNNNFKPVYYNTINPNKVNIIEYKVEKNGLIAISYVISAGLTINSKELYLSRENITIENNSLAEYSLNNGGIDSSGNIGDAYHYFYTSPIYLKKGQTITAIVSGYSASVISKTNETITSPVIPLVKSSTTNNYYVEKYSYIAEEDMYVTVCGYYILSITVGFMPLKDFVLKNINNNYFNLDLRDDSYKTDIIALYKNHILKDVKENDNRYFYYSSDCGETFVKSENKIGDITFVHFFSNKHALICTKTKAYYTTDFGTFNESIIYDYNGSIFVANSSHFWYEGQYLNENIIIGNKEIAVWSDYNIESGYISRIWISYDSGKIVRCILKSGETEDINSSIISVRHFHDAKFDKYRNCIWITSGDGGDQCIIAKGLCDSNIETWKWEIIGKGDLYKFGQIHVKEKSLLLVTDYTGGTKDTGLLECPIEFLSNIDYYNYIYKTDNKSAVLQYFKDNNGNVIITPDGLGYLNFYFAKNNTKLRRVQVISDEYLAPIILIGPNYNGDVVVLGSDGYNIASPSISQFTRYLFSKAMRDAGVLDFCKNCI